MPHLSIGEVLGLLLEEFPDVTISKIRFLESQGLIDPERTPSGYRKFFDDDVELLRVHPARAARELPAAARDQGPHRLGRDRPDRRSSSARGASATVDTMPEETMVAFQDHGEVALTLTKDVGDCAEAVHGPARRRHRLRRRDRNARARGRAEVRGLFDELLEESGRSAGSWRRLDVARLQLAHWREACR